jgi:fructose-bisphosphate aldolase class II
MPIATPEVYAEMLGRAKEHSFAFPAINCVGSESVNAAIKGFADAGSDGIIQFSTGGAEFASGLGIKEMVTGAVALAEFAHVIAAKYPITVALHTDHCQAPKIDVWHWPQVCDTCVRGLFGGWTLWAPWQSVQIGASRFPAAAT